MEKNPQEIITFFFHILVRLNNNDITVMPIHMASYMMAVYGHAHHGF
jgi:hypothetical protein